MLATKADFDALQSGCRVLKRETGIQEFIDAITGRHAHEPRVGRKDRNKKHEQLRRLSVAHDRQRPEGGEHYYKSDPEQDGVIAARQNESPHVGYDDQGNERVVRIVAFDPAQCRGDGPRDCRQRLKNGEHAE
jgi:hypothetical protein